MSYGYTKHAIGNKCTPFGSFKFKFKIINVLLGYRPFRCMYNNRPYNITVKLIKQ